MSYKEWKIPYSKPEYPEELRQAGCGPLLAAVLALRGVRTVEEAKAFVCGSESDLHDPLLMADMPAGRDRLLRAIRDRETVAVFGDYDVDGITSTCLVTDYLRSKGLVCHPYIPDRSGEGYGLNCAALDALRAKGVSLVITVDCGITAVEEAEHAAEIGMDMIITDHHECGCGPLPRAAAVIDCRRGDDSYPNRHLAGVGVAMKLICACEGDQAAVLDRYGDLAAIGTVADVMPLVGENRYIVRRGLRLMEEAPRPGIAALFREAAINADKLNAAHLSFGLAPRLNAAGRLDSPLVAAKLLMSQDEDEAARLAKELCELNRRRQSIETDIWQQAVAILDGREPDEPIVLVSESWHQGVIGIAAHKIAEQYSLPAIIIYMNGEVGKGSCRSCEGFNIHDALSACSEHLLDFGGHALAAGLTLRADQVDAFRQALAEYYRANRPTELPGLRCDLLIDDPAMLSLEDVRSLDLLEPYGNGNPRPLMCVSGAELVAAYSVSNGRHLRMRVRLGRSFFECIFFSHTAQELGLREGMLVDLAFTPQVNEYRGNVSVQFNVSAARPHDGSRLCEQMLEDIQSVLWAAAPHCPDRADFVRVWQGFGRDFSAGEDLEQLLAQCPLGMAPERFCICLLVFMEAGLLQSTDGRVYGARPATIEGKADLEATALMRSLRAQQR